MLGLIEALLVLIGFLAVVGLAGLAFSAWLAREAEATDPYRDGLNTAARISALAWEAEQAMYRAAWKEHNE